MVLVVFEGILASVTVLVFALEHFLGGFEFVVPHQNVLLSSQSRGPSSLKILSLRSKRWQARNLTACFSDWTMFHEIGRAHV